MSTLQIDNVTLTDEMMDHILGAGNDNDNPTPVIEPKVQSANPPDPNEPQTPPNPQANANVLVGSFFSDDAGASGDDKSKSKDDKNQQPNSQSAQPSGNDLPQDQVKSVLGKVQSFLIKAGIWSDYEGRSEELTNDQFADISVKQAQHALQNHINSLSEPAQKVLRFLASGGDENEIPNLFAKSKEISSNHDSDDKKLAAIRSYYSELGWSDTKINSQLESVKTKGQEAIEAEYNETFPLLKKIVDGRVTEAEKKRKQTEYDNIAKANQQREAFLSNLGSRNDLSKAEQQLVADKLYNFNTDFGDRKVNGFFADFAKVQMDPNAYIDLVLFLSNKKAYLKKEFQKMNSTENKDTFNFLSTSGAPASTPSKEPVVQGIDWSGL